MYRATPQRVTGRRSAKRSVSRTSEGKRFNSQRSYVSSCPATPGGTLPSIFIEDLSMNTHDDSTYSDDASHSLLTILNTPRRVWGASPTINDPRTGLWMDEQTLNSASPYTAGTIFLDKPWLDASLEQYPKSPPLGRPRTSSLRSFGSSMDVIQADASGLYLDWDVLDNSPKCQADLLSNADQKNAAIPSVEDARENLRVASHAPTIQSTRKLRRRGRSQNLRDLFVRAAEDGEDEPPNTVYNTFEYQLTLAMLNAMNLSSAAHRTTSQCDKKPRRVLASLASPLGGLVRHLGAAGTIARF